MSAEEIRLRGEQYPGTVKVKTVGETVGGCSCVCSASHSFLFSLHLAGGQAGGQAGTVRTDGHLREPLLSNGKVGHEVADGVPPCQHSDPKNGILCVFGIISRAAQVAWSTGLCIARAQVGDGATRTGGYHKPTPKNKKRKQA